MIPETVQSDLIGRIYEAAVNPQKWDAFLQEAAKLFGSHTANIHFQDTSSLAVAGVLNMREEYVEAYRTHFGAINPFMKRTDVQLEGRVYVRRELIDTDTLVSTEFYNDWARPQGFFDFVCGTMVRRGPMAGNITFWRRQTTRQCGDEEVRRLQILMPHLVRAMHIHRRVAGAERKCEALGKALDMMRQALFLVTGTGHVVMMNTEAQRLASANDGLRIRHDMLEADRSKETSAIRHAIRCAAAGARGRVAPVPDLIAVPRRSLRRPFLVWIAPLPAGSLQDEENELLAVFVIDPDAESISPERALRQLFGLTPAESRLANALLQAEDLSSAAETFGISRNTARSQLQSIFSKTSTCRQGELVRLLAQLASVRRPASRNEV